MNRRSFFAKAGLLAATAVAPTLCLLKTNHVVWNRTAHLIPELPCFYAGKYFGKWIGPVWHPASNYHYLLKMELRKIEQQQLALGLPSVLTKI